MEEEEQGLDQPSQFDLELELLRWVKKALVLRVPPIMQKPGGMATQHYGLDSKSRWREAVCLMMILAEPAITPDGISILGKHMALLFRQDDQLWKVKATQLSEWVGRGLLNVKLLDRTLAYFQNQSSFLQYIKSLKQPMPRIESPGFPGTQWNEFYWKDQTVMLLMQETDFPEGKNPEFCCQLFAEEPGKWRLKMDQFKRWLERGKNDPLPEYYGTGKNCTECGVFLWDTKSYVKHMKRNHGFKVKDGKLVGISQEVLKRERIDEQREHEMGRGQHAKRSNETSPEQDPFDALIQSSSHKASPASTVRHVDDAEIEKYLLSEDSDLDDDTEDSISDVKEVGRIRTLKKETKEVKVKEVTPAVVKHQQKTKTDLNKVKDFDVGSQVVSANRTVAIPSPKETVPELVLGESSTKRASTARNKPPDEDTIVSCPECGHQCAHSKIINHLKKCTRKMAPTKKHSKQQEVIQEDTIKIQNEASIEKESSPPKKEATDSHKVEVKKPKEPKTAAIVKQIFMRKFAMQQEDSGQSEEDDVPKRTDSIVSPPPLKLKLHRKELSRESFEVSGDARGLSDTKVEDSFDKLEPLIKQSTNKEVYEFDSSHGSDQNRPKYRKASIKGSYKEDWDSSDFSLSSFRDTSDREDKIREERIKAEKIKEAKLKAEIEKLKAGKLQEIMQKEEQLKERLKAEKLKEIMLKEERMRQEQEKEDKINDQKRKEIEKLKEEQMLILEKQRKEEERQKKEEERQKRDDEKQKKDEERQKKEDERQKKEEERQKREEERKKRKEERKKEEEERQSKVRQREEEERQERERQKVEEAIQEKKRQNLEDMVREAEKKAEIKRNKELIKQFEDERRQEETQAEEDRSREEEEKSEDEFSLSALTKPHKRFQYSDYRSGKYQEQEKKREAERKNKEEEEKKKMNELEIRREEEKKVQGTEDSFAKLEPFIHPSPAVAEVRQPMLTKAAKKDIPSMIADDFAQEVFKDAKPSLRRGKMIPCPLCGVEYALASNLEKHIDRDHREEGREEEIRGRRKRRGTGGEVPKKRKRKEENEVPVGNLTSEVEEASQPVLQSPEPTVEILEKVDETTFTKEGEDKLTEYEIFQKLQMKEQKTDRKRVECSECGLHIPTNTIKRHQQKHEKDRQREALLAENPNAFSVVEPKKKVITKKSKKVPCPECGAQLPPNTLKRHVAKHKKGKEQAKATGAPVEQALSDERIPCTQCGKMLPKNAMKRHLMKHETTGQDETDGAAPEEKPEKAKVVRKKVACQECGLLCAANVMRRHLEKHRKAEAYAPIEITREAYAPIEITPTKEYWEMNEKKTVVKPEPKKVGKGVVKGGTGKVKSEPSEAKEAEKGKNSEEEGEEESPLEIAVRKVVSYRMTPKQALAEYKLTPKVLFDHLLGETDGDRLAILDKVSLSGAGEQEVIAYCREHEHQLSYRAVISTVRELKVAAGHPEFSLSKLEAYRWWYAFRKKFDLKITAKKK